MNEVACLTSSVDVNNARPHRMRRPKCCLHLGGADEGCLNTRSAEEVEVVAQWLYARPSDGFER